jgi:hypothetical protein
MDTRIGISELVFRIARLEESAQEAEDQGLHGRAFNVRTGARRLQAQLDELLAKNPTKSETQCPPK